MSLFTFIIILIAAFLHAAWNSIVKAGVDKKVAMSAVVIGHIPFGIFTLCFVPLPESVSWPYIIIGAAFHVGYQIFLLHAYRFGDMTQVYPVARGIAPLLVTLISAIFL